MSTLEIEVKFFLGNVETVRNLLQQAGARSQGRALEHNICFDNFQDVNLEIDTFLPLFEAG